VKRKIIAIAIAFAVALSTAEMAEAGSPGAGVGRWHYECFNRPVLFKLYNTYERIGKGASCTAQFY
jgi:hypothetical protein